MFAIGGSRFLALRAERNGDLALYAGNANALRRRRAYDRFHMNFSYSNTDYSAAVETDSESATAKKDDGIVVVLVVEDDPLLRMNAVDMIEEAGFQVVDAPDADAAIQLLEARNDIRLIFTDIDMPGSMDGLALAQAVANRWPPVRIVATSGHFKVRESDLPTGGRFLPKPYRQNDIVGMLQSLSDVRAR